MMFDFTYWRVRFDEAFHVCNLILFPDKNVLKDNGILSIVFTTSIVHIFTIEYSSLDMC